MFECEIKFAMKQNYKRNYIVNRHQHPCYEIVFYIDGEGESIFENTTYKFAPNTFTICEPNTFHKEIGYTKVELIYIGFDILSTNVKLKTGIYKEENYHILNDLLEIHSELYQREEFFEKICNILIEKILIKLKRVNENKTKEQTDNIQMIKDYVKINCMKNINVKDLSKVFSFNYDYMRRMFKEKTGMSIKDYILKEKILYAVDLLKNTTFSIKEISEMSGFSSPSHFTVLFKQEMNMTPKEYVNKYITGTPHQEIADYDGNQIAFIEGE